MSDTDIALNLNEASLNMVPITRLTWSALTRMASTLRLSILYQRNETQTGCLLQAGMSLWYVGAALIFFGFVFWVNGR